LRLLTIIIFLLIPTCVLCQEGDSEFGKYKINKNFCLRIEHGWQKSWYTSLGASYVYSNVNSHTPFVIVLYAAVDGNLRGYWPRTPFYAYKAGFECGGLLLAYGAEVRNNTDFSGKNHLIFMPKAGLSFYGHFSIFYGYSIFQPANNIFGINNSQISVSVSLNRKVFKESLIPSHP
jgi:hypothetical protein